MFQFLIGLFPFQQLHLLSLLIIKGSVSVLMGAMLEKGKPLYVGAATFQGFLGGDGLRFDRRTADPNLENSTFDDLCDRSSCGACYIMPKGDVSY